MELTPEVLHEQEFRAARRGYDMREVDEFLERVAVAVAQLLEQLKAAVNEADAAKERIGVLEQELRDTRGPSAEESEETLRRTLMLAQKTADSTIAEAEEKAAKIASRAEQQAAFVIREANEAAERARIQSESQARRAGEETRRRMLEEITALERTREALSSDVRTLRRYLDDQRTRMRTAARDLQRLADDPTALKEFDAPKTSDASLADLDLDLDGETGDPTQVPSDEDAAIDEWLSSGEDWDAVDDGFAETDEETAAPPAPPTAAGDDLDLDLDVEVNGTGADDTAAQPSDDDGALDGPSLGFDEPDDDDADYFEDLRRAMNEPDDASESTEA